jgi:pentatricopeptide repeat protein
VLVTTEPVEPVDNKVTFEGARQLVRSRRFAEAYDALRQLLDSGIEPMACVRDLVWICEHWDRLDEANTFRYRYGPEPTEQLHLF